MNCERIPYPELECSLRMSRVEGLLQFLKGQTMMDWRGSETEKQAISEALDHLREAQDEYKKVLTLLKQVNKIEL